MNIILFQKQKNSYTLTADNPRTQHIRSVLKMGTGDSLYVGAINGPRGKATLKFNADESVSLSVKWDKTPPKHSPLTLCVGLPRPQTARKILQEMTTIGAAEIHFFQSNKGDPNYRNSKLWTSDEWKNHLTTGAEQAFSTTTPRIVHHKSLQDCIEKIDTKTNRIALDIYKPTASIQKAQLSQPHTTLLLGPEAGWDNTERDILRSANFTIVHMGERVQRSETACVSASAILLAMTGQMDQPYIPES